MFRMCGKIKTIHFISEIFTAIEKFNLLVLELVVQVKLI
jgi:hypothetical protein